MRILRSLLIVALWSTPIGASPPDPTIDSALGRLVTALRASSAEDLRSVLSADRKVYLAVPAIDHDEGFLGADQVYYLFLAFFERNVTHSFDVDRETIERTGTTTFVQANWSYRGADGEEHTGPLSFTFVREGSRWLVREIRAARS